MGTIPPRSPSGAPRRTLRLVVVPSLVAGAVVTAAAGADLLVRRD